MPYIKHVLFFKIILTPSFLRPLIVLRMSPDLGKLYITDLPKDCEPKSKDLIDKLLSPSTFIILLKFRIFFFNN